MNNNLTLQINDNKQITEMGIQINSGENESKHNHQVIIQYESKIKDDSAPQDNKPIIELPKNKAINGNIFAQFIELLDKVSLTLTSSTLKDIEKSRDINKTHREKVLVKIDSQIELKDKASKESKVSRILSWVSAVFAIVFATAATIFTAGGATPLLIGAAVALGMTILQETGALDKLTEIIGKEISAVCVKLGYSKEAADSLSQKIAMAIVTVAVLVITIASCCTGNVSSIPSLTVTLTRFAPKIAIMVQKMFSVGSKMNNLQRSVKIATRAELFGQGVLKSTEGGLNIDSGINQGEAETNQADCIRMTSLQKMIEKILVDNSDFIKNIMNSQRLIFTNCMNIIKEIQETSLKLTRQNNV